MSDHEFHDYRLEVRNILRSGLSTNPQALLWHLARGDLAQIRVELLLYKNGALLAEGVGESTAQAMTALTETVAYQAEVNT